MNRQRKVFSLTLCALAAAVLAAVLLRSKLASDVGVDLDAMRQLIDRADRLVVLEERYKDAQVLFETSRREDMDALRSALRVERPDNFVHCMCIGSPAIYFYSGTERIGQITNHHGSLIRCSLWFSDAPLVDPEPLLKWFDDRGVHGARLEVEDARARQARAAEDKQRWLGAMPLSLKPFWPDMGGFRTKDLAPMMEALAEQHPDLQERILSLLAWFGSGSGPWSGYWSYESVAEALLLEHSTEDLVPAIQAVTLTRAQTEGAARLFGGWDFSQQRPGESQRLPAELRHRLLQHALASDDEDKRLRAQNALGEPRD